jgi:hypothetical protein
VLFFYSAATFQCWWLVPLYMQVLQNAPLHEQLVLLSFAARLMHCFLCSRRFPAGFALLWYLARIELAVSPAAGPCSQVCQFFGVAFCTPGSTVAA